jgi:hypothetical protein
MIRSIIQGGQSIGNYKQFNMFNEQEWLKVLFLLNDTQAWIDGMAKELFTQLPVAEKKKFLRKNYYLSATVLAHILERHYHKIERYTEAGKFTIPVTDILDYLREAYSLPVKPVPGCANFQRLVHTNRVIGYDRHRKPVKTITILTDGGGNIVTAFPGPLYAEMLSEEGMLVRN